MVDFPVDPPTNTSIDDLNIVVDPNQSNKATIGSESDSLPTVVDWEMFLLVGSVGTSNRGLWCVRDESPSTSQFTAVKLSATLPVTDHDIAAGAVMRCGGHMYLHTGERIGPDLAEVDRDNIARLELIASVVEPPPPPPE